MQYPTAPGPPVMIDIEKETLANTDFRRVIWTGNHTQIVLMSLLPNETIDREIHPYVDQFFRVEEGVIMVQIEDENGYVLDRIITAIGKAAIVPSGTWHAVYAGPEGAKLYTNYSPPNHPPTRIQATKPPPE